MTTPHSLHTSDYGSFAWFYRKHWCSHYHPWAMAVLERILLPRLPRRAAILDLCCGVGTLSAALAGRGYRITGVDSCEEMLARARETASGTFLLADARDFRMPGAFHAAISTFDSLNHILTARDLGLVFANVYASLVPGGSFAFDVNLEEVYRTAWTSTCTVVENDNAFFVRGRYDEEQRLATTEITTFRFTEAWQRCDTTLLQRCHPEHEVRAFLAESGFSEVIAYDVPKDLGIEGQPGYGRAFFLAVK